MSNFIKGTTNAGVGGGPVGGNESVNTTPFKSNQTVSFGNLKVCIDRAEKLTSKEGWRESFRKLTMSIVQETPVSTLRACCLIPYETTPPDLFNACFVSIWVKLSEREQNEIICYLELALRNSDVPEIIKMILNLAEFIERCDIGFFLPLDYRLLADKAFQAKAYAKALHYVEEQFHSVMALSSNSNNMSGICNGVGGVSGAGGGPSATAGAPTAIMNMNSQQQQQYLIYLLEKLVTLNHELQRTEAAMGVLDFAGKYLKTLDSQTKVKERWYEKLHQWQKALNIYEKELNLEQPVLTHRLPGGLSSYILTEPNKLTEAKLEQLMGRMRCLKGLGEWKRLQHSCSDLLKFFTSNEKPNVPQIVTTSYEEPNLSNGHHQSTSQSTANVQNYFQTHIRQASSHTLAGTASTIGNIVLINPSNSTSGQTAGNISLSTNEPISLLQQLSASQQTDYKAKIAEMGAAACWGLGDWEKMDNYVQYMPENYDSSLYKSVLALTLNGKEKQSALSLIEHTRDLLFVDLSSMASQSYERSYQAIIEAQVLAELEEIITYQNIDSKRDWLRETWWRRLQGCERSLEYWHRLLLVRSIVLPKEKEIKPWLKFSSLCQKAGYLGLSHQILRSLLGNEDNLVTNQTTQTSTQMATSTREYEMCKYSYFKYLYANGSKKEAFNKLNEFHLELKAQLNQFDMYQQQVASNSALSSMGAGGNVVPLQVPAIFQMYNQRDLQKRKTELDMQMAKCYLKLGSWQYELEGFREPANISLIINYYESAKDHNRDSYKAWQAWAYANYEAIQFYKNHSNLSLLAPASPPVAAAAAQMPTARSNDSLVNLGAGTLQQQLYLYVKPAIQGFFTCIKLSSSVSASSSQESNCLQDTLRLLTVWFDYCNNSEIYDVLYEGIKHTPMEIWLQVIPQLIARIDTNKQFVARLIHSLLIEFGRVHPQALVYRLILASKCSNNTNAK